MKKYITVVAIALIAMFSAFTYNNTRAATPQQVQPVSYVDKVHRWTDTITHVNDNIVIAVDNGIPIDSDTISTLLSVRSELAITKAPPLYTAFHSHWSHAINNLYFAVQAYQRHDLQSMNAFLTLANQEMDNAKHTIPSQL